MSQGKRPDKQKVIAKIAEWLSLLIAPDQVAELRALKVSRGRGYPHVQSGFFDGAHLGQMAEAAFDLTPHARGVYFTINPLKTDILARRANRVDRAESGELAADRDVIARRWLLIDVDPVRDAHISSSDGEKASALDLIHHIRDDLASRSWPAPILCDSGNGYHALYRIDLGTDDSGLVKQVLQALATRYDIDTAHVDTSVFNPARICKLPGTRARKGDHTEDRPHRWARVLDVPDTVEIVPRELLEALAAESPEPTAPRTAKSNANGWTGHTHSNNGNGDYQHRLLVDKWLADAGIGYRVKPQLDNLGRTVYVLKECPFDQSHGDPDSCIMQASDGALSGRCFHNSCCGRGWQQFKEAIGKPKAHHYHPPMVSNRRAKRTAKSATTETARAFGGFPLTDLGNAERLQKRHGLDLHHCHPWKRWLRWDGRSWVEDQTGAVTNCAVETVRSIYAEAATCKDDKARAAIAQHAKQSESAAHIRAMIDLGRAQPGIPILPREMDPDGWLLNCPNGTLDLRSGTLHEHRRANNITRVCDTEYLLDAPCPAWLQFLAGVFPDDDDEPDAELITFIKRLMGRCLTADVSEQILPIFWGSGANGKSTLINAILDVLGRDYSMKANADLLMTSNQSRHPCELAQLFGTRLVVASETQQGRRLNETLVKDLTGGEPIRARRMHENFWEFNPTHKTILLTNHKPRIDGTDEGIWRRLRLVPFTTTFWDPADPNKTASELPSNLRQDKKLGEKLKNERAGILAWLVRGCLDWQRDGLPLPQKVRTETKEYRESEDVFARWISDLCVTGDGSFRERSGRLYESYKGWCESGGERILSQREFSPALEERGYTKKSSDGVWFLGIALRKS